jgi:hypothetical protein
MAMLVSPEADTSLGWEPTRVASWGQQPVGIAGGWRYIAAACVDRITGVGMGARVPL